MQTLETFKKYFKPVQEEPSKIEYSICKECGGKCCHSLGCHISPHDLLSISKESIRNLIDESQCISIDWWDGNPITGVNDGEKSFFLRIKNKNSFVVDPSFGGICSILTDSGCPLNFAYRPKGARELIPVPGDKDCNVGYSKQECAADWLPYNDILRELCEEYIDKDDCTVNALLDFNIIDPIEALNIMSQMFESMFGGNHE